MPSVGSVSVRVVPDAQNFVSSLRNQLDSKSKELGDRVGANIGQAAARNLDPAISSAFKDMDKAAGKDGAKVGKSFSQSLSAEFRNEVGKALSDFTGGKDIKLDVDVDDDAVDRLRARLNELRGDRVGFIIDADVNTKYATAKLDELQRKIKQLADDAPSVKVELDDFAARIQLGFLRGQLAQLEAQDPKVSVGLNDTAARAQLAFLRGKLDELARTKVSIGVELNAGLVRAQIAGLKQQAASVGNTIKITPEVDDFVAKGRLTFLAAQARNMAAEKYVIRIDADTNAATVQLAGLYAMAQRLAGASPNITVTVNAGGAMTAMSATQTQANDLARDRIIEFEANIASAMAQISVLQAKVDQLTSQDKSIDMRTGANIIPILGGVLALVAAIGAAAPAAAAGVAAIGAGAGALGQGLAAGIVGFNGIADAVKAVNSETLAGFKTTQESTKTQMSQANAVANAQAGLASAIAQSNRSQITGAEGVADAQRALGTAIADSDRQAVQSARQVASARRAVQDAVESAAERIANSERSVARAQQSSRTAQEDLTRARRDALEAVRDLQLQLSGSALSEERARYNVLRAQQELVKGMSAGKGALEQWDLQLSVKEAVQNLAEVRSRYAGLKQDEAEYNATGIEGSRQVVSAQRQVTSSLDSVADAQRALTAARTDGSRDVQRAQEAYALATENASYQAKQSAASVAAAQEGVGRAARSAQWQQEDAARSVASAQRGLEQAVAAAGVANTAAAQKAAFALSQLSPAGREFVRFWTQEMQPAFQGLSGEIAEKMLPNVQKGFRNVIGLAPLLRREFSESGRIIGTTFERITGYLAGGLGQAQLARIMDSNNRAFETFGDVGYQSMRIVLTLVEAAGPMLEGIARYLADSARGFADFLENARGTGELQKWFAAMNVEGAKLWHFVLQVTEGIVNLVLALGPAGDFLMAIVGPLVEFIGWLAQLSPILTSIIAVGFVFLALAVGIGNAFQRIASAVFAKSIPGGIRGITAGFSLLTPAGRAAAKSIDQYGTSAGNAGKAAQSATKQVQGLTKAAQAAAKVTPAAATAAAAATPTVPKAPTAAQKMGNAQAAAMFGGQMPKPPTPPLGPLYGPNLPPGMAASMAQQAWRQGAQYGQGGVTAQQPVQGPRPGPTGPMHGPFTAYQTGQQAGQARAQAMMTNTANAAKTAASATATAAKTTSAAVSSANDSMQRGFIRSGLEVKNFAEKAGDAYTKTAASAIRGARSVRASVGDMARSMAPPIAQGNVAPTTRTDAQKDKANAILDQARKGMVNPKGYQAADDYIAQNTTPLNPAQAEAVRKFTGTDEFQKINEALRKNLPLTKEQVKLVRDLDSAMKPLPDTMRVFRTSGLEEFGGTLKSAQNMQGKVATNRGYTSTSLGVPYGLGMGGSLNSMTVPQGTRGIVTGANSAKPNEREVILARGLETVIAKAKENALGLGVDMHSVAIGTDKAAQSVGGKLLGGMRAVRSVAQQTVSDVRSIAQVAAGTAGVVTQTQAATSKHRASGQHAAGSTVRTVAPAGADGAVSGIGAAASLAAQQGGKALTSALDSARTGADALRESAVKMGTAGVAATRNYGRALQTDAVQGAYTAMSRVQLLEEHVRSFGTNGELSMRSFARAADAATSGGLSRLGTAMQVGLVQATYSTLTGLQRVEEGARSVSRTALNAASTGISRLGTALQVGLVQATYSTLTGLQRVEEGARKVAGAVSTGASTVTGAVRAMAAGVMAPIDSVMTPAWKRAQEQTLGFGNTATSLRDSMRVTGTMVSNSVGSMASTVGGHLRGVVTGGFNMLRDSAAAVTKRAGDAFVSFGGVLGGVGATVKDKLMRNLGNEGLMGVLGGPWGIAITGATVIAGLWADKQQDAAKKVAEHRAKVDELKGSLDGVTGATTNATLAQAANEVATNPALARAREFGIATDDLARAMTGNQGALAKVNGQLLVAAERAVTTGGAWKNYRRELEANGLSLDVLKQAQLGNKDALDKIRFAIDVAGGAGTEFGGVLNSMLSDIENNKNGLFGLGTTIGSNNDMLRAASDEQLRNAAAYNGVRTAIEGVTGSLTTFKDKSLEAFGGVGPVYDQFREQLNGVSGAARDSALAAGELARRSGDVSGQATKASDSMRASRQGFIDSATAMGVPRDQAEQLANKMGLIPGLITTQFNTLGVKEADQALGILGDKIKSVDNVTGAIIVDGQQIAARRAELEGLGFKLINMPDGTVHIYADTTPLDVMFAGSTARINATTAKVGIGGEPLAANATLDQVVGRINLARGRMNIEADPLPANATTQQTLDWVNRQWGVINEAANTAPAGDHTNQRLVWVNGQWSWINVAANTEEARGAGQKVKDDIAANPPVIVPGVDGSRAQTFMDRVKGWWSSWTDNPFSFTPNPDLRLFAMGGIAEVVGMATGGVRAMAAGTASVVGPRTPTLIGDRKTDDEAYIPINRDARSIAILTETAARMGFTLAPAAGVSPLQPMAAGGIGGTAPAVDTGAQEAAAGAAAQVTGALAAQAQVAAGLPPALSAVQTSTTATALAQTGLAAQTATMLIPTTQSLVALGYTPLVTALNTTVLPALTGLSLAQTNTQLQTTATAMNTAINTQSMTASTTSMSLASQGQYAALQGSMVTTQNTASAMAAWIGAQHGNINASTFAMSNYVQTVHGVMQGSMDAVGRTAESMASAVDAQYGRAAQAVGGHIRWTYQFPLTSLVGAFNKLNADYALNLPGASLPPLGFHTGGAVPGMGNRDSVSAKLTPGEYVWSKPAIEAAGGIDKVHAAHQGLRAGDSSSLRYLNAGGPVQHFAAGGPVQQLWPQMFDIVRQAFPTATNNSNYRAGDPGWHGRGKAVDLGGPMMAINRWLAQRYPNSTELIHTPGINLWHGAPHTYNAETRAGHYDHVHWAMADSAMFDGKTPTPGWAGGGSSGAPLIDVDKVMRETFATTYQQLDTQKATGGIAGVASGMVRKLADGMQAKGRGALEAMAFSGMGPMGSGEVMAQIAQAFRPYGWDTGPQWSALMWILSHESGFNPTVKNPISTAYGLFQFLDSTWGAYGGQKTDNPLQQSVLGAHYIKERYGDPIGAQRFWAANGWYDKGGEASTPGYLPKLTPKPERVLSPQQTQSFNALVASITADDFSGSSSSSGESRTFNVYPRENQSEESIAHAVHRIDSFQNRIR